MWKISTSPGKIRHHIRTVGPVFTLAVATLWLLQISLSSALVVTLALAVVMQSGRALAANSGLGDVGLGVGFVVGAGTFVFSGQALIIAGIPAYVTHWCVLSVMVAVTALISRPRATADFTDVPSVGAEALFALSIALIVLSMRHPWVFPFAIPVAILERYRHHTQHQVVLRLLTASLIPVGWLVASVLRPDRWWYFYQGNDSQYFEAIGWSISQWGVFEHPGFVGGSIANYHWLSSAFFGAISHVGLLGPWDALMKIGSPLLAFAFVGIFISRPTGKLPKILTPGWIFLVLVIAVMPTGIVNSFAFSILVAFAVFRVVEEQMSHKTNALQVFICSLLSFTLIFSKFTTAAVLLLPLGLLLFLQLFRKERINCIFWGCLLTGLVVLQVSLFREASSKSVFVVRPFDLETGAVALRTVIGSPTYATQFLLWVTTALTFRSSFKSIPSFHLAAAATAVVGLSYKFGQANALGVADSFGLPGIYLVTYLMTRLWLKSQQDRRERKTKSFPFSVPTLSLLVVGVVLGFLWTPLLNRVNSSFKVDDVIGGNLWQAVLGSGYILVIISMLIVLRTRITSELIESSLIVMLSLFVGGSLNYAVSIAAESPESYIKSEVNSAPFPTRQLVLLGDYVQSTIGSDVILATNNFCCVGQDWWTVIQRSQIQPKAGGLESQWGGANYLLSAQTRRRFLVEGPRFQAGFGIYSGQLPTEQMNRMSLSLEFANTPSASSLRKLKAYGVSGYVVNLSLTEHRDWSEFAIERFRSGDFVYLELR